MFKGAKLIAKIPFYWTYRYMNWPKMLPVNYIYNLTSQCNSRCKTCKIWEHQKEKQELSYQQWSEIVKKIGNLPVWISLSGGEPFLFEEIDRLVNDIFIFNRPKLLVIPTNAILTETIENKIKKILSNKSKGIHLTINLSLDGVGNLHDEIRGIPGNFDKVIATYNMLRNLTKGYSEVTIGIHTVLSKWNISRVKEISDFVVKKLSPDQHIFEIAEVRAEMFNSQDSPTPSIEEYEQFLEFWSSNNEFKLWRNRLTGIAKVNNIFRNAYYRYLKDAIFDRKRKPLVSFSGFATAYITPWAEVWDCAVYANSMGSLSDYELDFRKFWQECPGVKRVQDEVKKGHLCPFANEDYINLLFSPWELVKL